MNTHSTRAVGNTQTHLVISDTCSNIVTDGNTSGPGVNPPIPCDVRVHGTETSITKPVKLAAGKIMRRRGDVWPSFPATPSGKHRRCRMYVLVFGSLV